LQRETHNDTTVHEMDTSNIILHSIAHFSRPS